MSTMRTEADAFAVAVVAPDNAPHNPRRSSQEMQSSREPFNDGDNTTTVQESNTEFRSPEESIEDLVDRLIIHGDQCTEHLPIMTSPELRIIGKAVSFSLEKTVNGDKKVCYYTGLVSSVTAAAVTLMHVNCYTEKDFELYKKRERSFLKKKAVGTQNLKNGNSVRSSPSEGKPMNSIHALSLYGNVTEEEVRVEVQDGLAGNGENAALLRVDAAGSLAAATQFSIEVTEAEPVAFSEGQHAGSSVGESPPPIHSRARAAFRSKVSSHSVSFGPLPFASFQRKRLRNVRFCRDPRSSFYSLFEDPSKKLMDMQYLRMFVRRYLVHTSQCNNPDKIPLYTFVTSSSGCSSMDHELVNRVAREELLALMQIDKLIERNKKQQQNSENGLAPAAGVSPRRNAIFARTGVLFHTRIPHHSLVTGVVIAALIIICAFYISACMNVYSDPFISYFLLETVWVMAAALVVWALAAAATISHAFYMRIPLRKNFLLLVARGVLCVGAVVCSITFIIITITRMSHSAVYNYMVSQPDEYLCSFYQRKQCTGLDYTCSSRFRERALCPPSCTTGLLHDITCQSEMWTPIHLLYYPLVVVSVVILFVFTYSLLLTVRVVLVAHNIERMRP
ncbi:hypothetical protein ABL78_7866 [Leptomonas seymouri]|uniref:Uncharacterized protein n=1 Tax=Leptomonas seymouri TaxID=5684 RepID=A0A0N1P9A0_LEPSE|nr:hypothetical protein ABL78_7866 [Leptomonas seymouri]|eukprot:KPI83108.1 hypothetical protein ABL78_7866 [Leptomonas seymouri]